ncbi:hypothetical protein [Methylocystis heyeri]|uniref:Uncharacterized protein n=1 Tax=Methylocystis heyeri TaxID=391905 RepID=A0A6B8KEF8_9HYPH|nr:hypothetical protein [Methylocystis heyeri]QGM46676.1 hypothetical protein H2LOC_013780 [Methylocystis heyeri]
MGEHGFAGVRGGAPAGRRGAALKGPLCSLIIAALATLIAAAWVNFSVDCGAVFLVRRATGSQLVESFVSRLRVNASGLVTPDQTRLIKLELARRSEADCFVIGSSHVYQFDAETAPGLFAGCREVTNLSVPAGGFEDMVIIAQLFTQRRERAHLFIETPTWALRPNPVPVWANEYADVYDRARSALGLPPRWSLLPMLHAGASLLLSYDYLAATLKKTFRTDFRQREAQSGIAAADRREDEDLILPSGRFAYSDAEPVSPGLVNDGSFNTEEPALDVATVEEFESVIGALLARGHRLSFIITPYHPSVPAACRAPAVCRCQKAVENYVRAAAARWDATVIGSFDPRPLGILASDFMDAQHLMLSGVSKLKLQAPPEQAGTAR